MKSILLVINNLGCYGSPLYAHSVALILKRNGFCVNVWSYDDGILRTKYEKDCINVEIVNPEKTLRTNIEKNAGKYDCMIAFTILTFRMVQFCCNIVPTVWYIHEGQNLEEYLREVNCRRIFLQKHRIWVVSEYTQEYIYKTWKKQTEVIHNFVPDVFQKYQNVEKPFHKEIRFLLLGNMIERKAFDVFFEAFLILNEADRHNCELHYAGVIPDTDYSHDLISKIKQYNNVIYHGVILDEQIYDLYQYCDVVVIPSRDESCSLVALEASMMGMPCIISENVGARYMIDSENGWIVKTEDVEALSLIFHNIIVNKYDLVSMGRKARIKYLRYSTEEVYENILLKNLIPVLSIHKTRWKLVYRMKHVLQKKKDIYEESPFKFLDIPKGSRIILYGAGKNGKKWKAVLDKTPYCKVVAWVDKNADGKVIKNPDSILGNVYDYVLITVINKDYQKEISEELADRRIPNQKIKILDE